VDEDDSINFERMEMLEKLFSLPFQFSPFSWHFHAAIARWLRKTFLLAQIKSQ